MRFPAERNFRGANASIPFAELMLDDEGVHIRLRWAWGPGIAAALPPINLAFSEIDRVERIKAPVIGRKWGLRFWYYGGNAVVFWCRVRTRKAAEAELERLGLPVDQEVVYF